MLTGGKFVVAGVGVVALVVAGFFIVRSLWLSPSDDAAFSRSSLSASPSSTPPSGASTDSTAPTGDAGEAGNPGDPGGTGEGGSSTSVTTTTSSESSPPPAKPSTDGITATSKQVDRILGSVSVDVELPQVQGSNDTVVGAFNDGMDSALLAQAAKPGTLQNRPGSEVRIGKRVVAGLLATTLTKGAESTQFAGTVVIDADTGSEVALPSLFEDETAGLAALVELANELGPEANSSFDTTVLQADADQFKRWTPDVSGLTVYFDQGLVAPDSDGVVPVTIPWDRLSDVANSAVVDVVSS